jgi:hypothetical protein
MESFLLLESREAERTNILRMFSGAPCRETIRAEVFHRAEST